MTKHDEELSTISIDALTHVIGGAGVDPSMSAKGDAFSFGATGCNGPAGVGPNAGGGGGGGGGNLMTLL